MSTTEVPGVSEPEAEDIIALDLIAEGQDVDDSVMAHARRILSDLEASGLYIVACDCGKGAYCPQYGSLTR